ncbi:indolepyruvate ferredoxin oxidoreductase [Microtetraspora sp. NBRC 13810]|uniref:indolepyruvate ferredoxin oxidoreductase family protein n=1 Tax=Microtetraspora sp. NBRC 13810 TaxID=3030990 RepID=UPI0024A5381B|nr:indolepyruvate ferredoxin oxidoreductase family protein [Microtetraspora sp. NBRC 13810]GLW06932.1 indolepyruvate ferredoxin oxidoreductase [Microtetraspora sp. NBRC 13810]
MAEPITLDDRYLRREGEVYLTGIQALVRVLLDRSRADRLAGVDGAAFVSGYEGSPLAGFDLELGRRAGLLAEHGIVHTPGLNEELAATSVMGSQLAGAMGTLRPDGVVGVWYGKAPGLDRASDAIRHANLAGAHPRGGALALVGDDPGAKSSTVPSASELALADLALPIFYPADVRDVLDHGRHAVELSRASGLWTAMKVVTDVADSAGTVALDTAWARPELPASLRPYRHVPNGRLLGADLAALEHGLYTVRLPIALEYLRISGVNRIGGAARDARIGIVSAGKTYLALRQALRALGLADADLERYGIRLLKLGVIHPVEPEIVREFAAGLGQIVVVEEKRSFLEGAVKEILYGRAGAPEVRGKSLFSPAGELGPDTIASGLARVLGDIEPVAAWRGRRRRERLSLPLLARTPYFCSGCPHNSSTKVPEGSLVGAGIGCHTMALFMPPEQVGDVIGLTQMGGEGAQWIGMAPFVSDRHFTQNIGDGTFTHSGSLAVRAAVASGVDITFKLLYNSAVAMTGGQRAVGGLTVERLTALLLLEGVSKVIVTSDDPGRLRGLPRQVEVRHRDDLLRCQEELAAIPGVTVLVHDQECATEKRRRRRRGKERAPETRVVVNERVCEGCGDCGVKSNCLSVQPVETEFGRKTRIHQSSCNLDQACLSGDCPSFVTLTPVRTSGGRPGGRAADPGLPPAPPPEPSWQARDFTVRITGIGGTGVVTTAQVLSAAAVIAGRKVRMLDQTGLAQKGGAVVSDIKITLDEVEQAPKLAAGECDLYLACDALVGADPERLAAADPARTTAIVSTTEVPTGRMVVDPRVSFPEWDGVRSVIEEATARSVYLDARGLSEELFGDDQYANILHLGAAYQAGAVPLPADAIEGAIRLNGTAAERNLQAFAWGRQVVADPAALTARRTLPAGPEAAPPARRNGAAAERLLALVATGPDTELARLLAVRVPDLVDYQDEAYAGEYVRFVERVRAAGSAEVAEAVARNLYKLMAYKDEYEVARLSLAFDPGPGVRQAYRLHPPLLRALGMKRKISLGPWFRPVFRLLYALRGLRGTPLDVFGYPRLRRQERGLPAEYREAVLRAVTLGDEATALELAALPDMVRGYEDIKLRAIAAYRDRQAALLHSLTGATASADSAP